MCKKGRSDGALVVQHELHNAVHSQLTRVELQLTLTDLGIADGHILVQHIHGDGVLAQVVEQFVHGCNDFRLTDVVAGTVGVAVLAALCQMPMIKASGRKGKSVDCLHSDEVEALQAALQECSMLEKAIVLCLLNTGVRRGELAGLTWKDVNFREGTIHVSKSLLVFPNYGYQLTTTKESNIRDVDVAPEFMDFLKDYYAQWKAQKKLMGASWQKNLEKKGSKYAQSLLDLRGNDFVICNDYGFPINPDSYGALVRRVGKKAGIEKIHPHMFRHTFVSILLSNPNIGVATVAAEAGHAQPSTTLAIYTQVYDRRRDEIRKQMSRELYK